MGHYIVVGLEFMIVSDIIRPDSPRELENLAFPGGFVGIRSPIGCFPGRELAEIGRERATRPNG